MKDIYDRDGGEKKYVMYGTAGVSGGGGGGGGGDCGAEMQPLVSPLHTHNAVTDYTVRKLTFELR